MISVTPGHRILMAHVTCQVCQWVGLSKSVIHFTDYLAGLWPVLVVHILHTTVPELCQAAAFAPAQVRQPGPTLMQPLCSVHACPVALLGGRPQPAGCF